MTEFIKNNRVYRQYPCFFQMKMQNKYISENNACIRLRRWTKIYPKSVIRSQCSKTLAIALFPNIFYFLVGILPVFVT